MSKNARTDDDELARRWHALAARAGIAAHERLVLGLSGGADSVALALLASAGTPAGDGLVLVHIDHGWRDGSAERALCRALAERLARPLHVERIDLDPHAPNAEARARAARYDVLAERAQSAGAAVVLTAHHRADRIETVLLHWRRSGALGGHMAADRTRALAPGVRLVRPLIDTPPARLRALLATCAGAWCDDPTNRDRARARNAVRHDLVPLLAQLSSGVDAGALLERLAAARARIDDVLDALVPKLDPAPWAEFTRAPHQRDLGGVCSVEPLAALAASVRADVLARLARRATGRATRRDVLDALASDLARGGSQPQRRPLAGGWIAQVRGARLALLPPAHLLVPAPAPRLLEAGDGPLAHLSDGRWVDARAQATRSSGDARERPARLRPWRPGDRLAAERGRPVRAVARRLAELGVPKEERDRTLVLELTGHRALVLGPLASCTERGAADDGGDRGGRDR